ncbi:hypothetical protein EMCRGX_G027590 [Ephydatia muelleri]
MFVAGLCGGLLLGVISVQSRPTGAPLTACPLIAPIGHVNTTRHPNNGSYGLSTDVFTGGVYVPGKNYTLTLKGTDVFKGLLVQARLVADQTTPVGSFTPGGVVKLSACTIASSAVTHFNGDDKDNATFVWTAPPSLTGTIQFWYAVVVNYDPANLENTYYTLKTNPIRELNGAAATVSPTALLWLVMAAVCVQASVRSY